MLLWSVKKRSKKGAVNSPALSECRCFTQEESVISDPSKDKLSK